MSIKVLWVTKGLGPGGAEALLAVSARSHDSAEFSIECAYVLPFKDHLVGQLEQAGVRCHCVSRHAKDVLWPVRLAKLVRNGDYDVIHVHSPLPGSVARIAAKLPGRCTTRVVTTEHNTQGSYAFPTRVLNRITSPVDAATFAVSTEALESIHGRARSTAAELTHGINVAVVQNQGQHRQTMRRNFGFTPEHIVIGTVANFRAQKSYPIFLEAVARAVGHNPQLRFVAVGQGPLEDTIRAQAAALGLCEQLTFTGYRSDAVAVMSSFDVFTLASSWEGLPVAVMEACALGLPIVATAVGGMAEILTDDLDAVLVAPDDPEALSLAWLRLSTDPQLRARLGRASLTLANRFDAGQTQDTIEQTYRRLANVTDPPSDVQKPPVKAKRPLPKGIELRPAAVGDRAEILALLQRSMNRSGDDRYAQLYQWKHDDNAFGSSPAWVATDSGRIVAVRVFMRWEFVRDGQVLRAVRAVDTATDPGAQGKGLFTLLTLHGLNAMADEGVDFVFNTPNDKSRPGYLKMGWRQVGRVPAAVKPARVRSVIAMAKSRVPASLWSEPLAIGCGISEWLANHQCPSASLSSSSREIATNRTADFLLWRYGNPLHSYRVVDTVHGDFLVVRARRRGAARELVVADTLGRVGGDPIRIPASLIREAGCDYAIHTGAPVVSNGQVSLPGGGPMLTWREIATSGCPPLANWQLTLGDIELF